MKRTCNEMSKRIAILKSESGSFQKYLSLLNQHKFDVQLIPTIDFEFKNQSELKTELNAPVKYQGIIFTSPRTVQAVYNALDGSRISESWSAKSIYCVGPTTWDEIQSKLGIDARGKESGNAENLSELIIEASKTENYVLPFLFPCSSLKQDTLGKKLSASNISLHPLEAYETVPHKDLKSAIDHLLQDNDIQDLVFFSPSGFTFTHNIVQEQNRTLTNKGLIAIGPSTAKLINEKGFDCETCASPTPEALLDVLTSHKNSKQPRHDVM